MYYYKKTDENGNLTLITTTMRLKDESAIEISADEFLKIENDMIKENENE